MVNIKDKSKIWIAKYGRFFSVGGGFTKGTRRRLLGFSPGRIGTRNDFWYDVRNRIKS